MSDSQDDETVEQREEDISTQQGISPEETIIFSPKHFCQRFINRQTGIDKYVMQGKVGEGGMGTILKVYDKDLKRYSVLKVMKPKLVDNEHLFRLFVEEARITGQLEHSNIVPVHDMGVIDDNHMFFSMKLMTSPTVLILSASSSGISTLNASSSSRTNSMTFKESALSGSSLNTAAAVTLSVGTSSCSATILITFSSMLSAIFRFPRSFFTE